MSIRIPIPSRSITIETVYFDFNGTLAVDGQLVEGVKERLHDLAKLADIYVFTADTFGTVRDQLSKLPVKFLVLDGENIQRQKSEHIITPPRQNAVVGNGLNDVLMLQKAAMSIVVNTAEGTHPKALMHADLLVGSPVDALDLLLHPNRIVAGCRG
ncbi:hypothetical protein VME0621_01238 [Vibrio mediterranei]|uniref:HAD family hydrolase n=1 Tax=Vibrio mediterranei TaxID=689 RepID=UPI0007845EE6|nr:HAD family hydrolase [Vibrio mediterranei]SBO09145.1 hypothetical protein VME0621_01238 [Vibrio mediterranei]